MSSFCKILTAFSQAQGWSLWWSNAASDREKEKKQGLWGMWGGRNRQIISAIFTSCCCHPITGICGQVAEDRAWKATHVAFVSCLLLRNSVSLQTSSKLLILCKNRLEKSDIKTHWCKHFRCFCCQCHQWCRLSVSPSFEGHVHETHGHQTSSEHREQSAMEQEEALSKGI